MARRSTIKRNLPTRSRRSSSSRRSSNRSSRSSGLSRSQERTINRSDASDAGKEFARRFLSSQGRSSSISSTSRNRRSEGRLRDDIRRISAPSTRQSSRNLRDVSDANSDFLSDARRDNEQRLKSNLRGIDRDFGQQQQDLRGTQNVERKKNVGNLISVGGFLGNSTFDQGNIQSLENDFKAQSARLESLRQDSIAEAQRAFEDKDFALSEKLIDEARQTEKDISDLEARTFNQQIQANQENRSATKDRRDFSISSAERLLNAAVESGEDLGPAEIAEISESLGLSPTVLQSLVDAKQETARLAKEGAKTTEDLQIIGTLSSVPQGQFVDINGVRYEGLKRNPVGSSGSGLTATQRRAQGAEAFLSSSEGAQLTEEEQVQALINQEGLSRSAAQDIVERDVKDKDINVLVDGVVAGVFDKSIFRDFSGTNVVGLQGELPKAKERAVQQIDEMAEGTNVEIILPSGFVKSFILNSDAKEFIKGRINSMTDEQGQVIKDSL